MVNIRDIINIYKISKVDIYIYILIELFPEILSTQSQVKYLFLHGVKPLHSVKRETILHHRYPPREFHSGYIRIHMGIVNNVTPSLCRTRLISKAQLPRGNRKRAYTHREAYDLTRKSFSQGARSSGFWFGSRFWFPACGVWNLFGIVSHAQS